MNKAIVKKEENAVSTEVVGIDDFGGGELSSRDIIIPSYILMQGLSKWVTDGTCRMGDIVESSAKKIMPKELVLIPFKMKKVWGLYKITVKGNETKEEFLRYEDFTPANENRQYEVQTGEGLIRSKYIVNVYFVNSDPAEAGLPIKIAFKGMSGRTGGELLTQMYVKNKAVGKSPVANTMIMYMERQEDKNKKGTHAVWKFKLGRPATPAEQLEAFKWFKIMRDSSNIQEDTTEERIDSSEAIPTTATKVENNETLTDVPF